MFGGISSTFEWIIKSIQIISKSFTQNWKSFEQSNKLFEQLSFIKQYFTCHSDVSCNLVVLFFFVNTVSIDDLLYRRLHYCPSESACQYQWTTPCDGPRRADHHQRSSPTAPRVGPHHSTGEPFTAFISRTSSLNR